MAGNKNSGRKTRYQHLQEGNLLDICTSWLVENFITFDKETKIKVAMEIAKKGIVQKVDMKVNHTVEQLMKTVESADRQAIGSAN